jgi:hypothetical protein
VEGSGIDGSIPAAENWTCLNSLKLSDPGVEISTDFSVSPSSETMPRRAKSESGPATPVNGIVPDVPRLSVQVTSIVPVKPGSFKLASEREVAEERVIRRREDQIGEGAAFYRFDRRKTRPGIDIPDRIDSNSRPGVTADRPRER